MKWFILIMFLFSSCLFFLAIFNLLGNTNNRLKKRMQYYLSMQDEKVLDRKKLDFMVQMQLYNAKILKRIASKKSSEKLEQVLQRAGLSLKPEEYLMFQWISTFLCAGILYLISGKVLLLTCGLPLGYLLPQWIVRRKQQLRIQKFNDGLPDMITVIVGSLRAGFSFPQSLKSVVEESGSPIREEIHQILKEMQYGTGIEEALQHLQDRMPSGDLELMIQAILIQRQVGGNLATVLDTIVQTIRDRNYIQRQVSTLTAQGRLSGIVIGLLPLVLGLTIYLINSDYIATLFTHPVGIALLAGGTLSGALGFFLIQKITTIEV